MNTELPVEEADPKPADAGISMPDKKALQQRGLLRTYTEKAREGARKHQAPMEEQEARDLARKKTKEVLRILIRCARDEETDWKERVRACQLLYEAAYGKTLNRTIVKKETLPKEASLAQVFRGERDKLKIVGKG